MSESTNASQPPDTFEPQLKQYPHSNLMLEESWPYGEFAEYREGDDEDRREKTEALLARMRNRAIEQRANFAYMMKEVPKKDGIVHIHINAKPLRGDHS